MNYYIKNATLVNEGQTFVASVFVSDGKIAKIVRENQVPEPVEGRLGKSSMPQANTSFLASSMNMCIFVSPD